MDVSLTMAYPLIKRGAERRDFAEAAYLCADAGIKYIDYTPDVEYPAWRDSAYAERDALEACGVSVGQMHAPFFREREKYDMDYYKKCLHATMEAAVIFGAPYVVAHADEYRVTDHYNEEEILRFTYEYLAPEVDFARKHGFYIAIENLFEEGAKTNAVIDGKSRFTARIDELEAVLSLFGNDIACCWDTGHAKLAFGNAGQPDALRRVGKYIKCTHFHDNYESKLPKEDLHLRPFLGEIDWEGVTRAFHDVGYSGNINFELHYGKMADALLPHELKMIYLTGRHLARMIENP